MLLIRPDLIRDRDQFQVPADRIPHGREGFLVKNALCVHRRVVVPVVAEDQVVFPLTQDFLGRIDRLLRIVRSDLVHFMPTENQVDAAVLARDDDRLFPGGGKSVEKGFDLDRVRIVFVVILPDPVNFRRAARENRAETDRRNARQDVRPDCNEGRGIDQRLPVFRVFIDDEFSRRVRAENQDFLYFRLVFRQSHRLVQRLGDARFRGFDPAEQTNRRRRLRGAAVQTVLLHERGQAVFRLRLLCAKRKRETKNEQKGEDLFHGRVMGLKVK